MPYTCKVRLEPDNLSIRMAEMREWLDRRGYEPDSFQYRMEAEGVLFRLDFKELSEAEAFVEAFGEAATVVW